MIGSMWAWMASWLTPTYLFLFLNLVIIGIILLNSLKNPLPQHHHQLGRAPSVLDRVKSINSSFYKSFETFNQHIAPENAGYGENQYPDDPPALVRTPSLLDRLKSINLPSLSRSHPPNSQTEIFEPPAGPEHDTVLEPDQSRDHDHLVQRSKSDSGPGSGKPEKMKKSASEKEKLGRSKEDEILERPVPATTRVERWSDKSRVSEDEEAEVDAKADDFINRFKQQLRLQRLDSLKRFGGMLKGKQS